MKKRSRILYIAAAVTALLGVLLCIISYFGAKKSGGLFSQTENEDGNYIFEYEFDGEAIKKLSINVDYADVNIIGGADADRIELVNFAEQRFYMTVSATTVTIGERGGLSGLFSFNFGGLRNYLNSVRILGKQKSINIYLTDESALRLLEADIYSGDISVETYNGTSDLELSTDYGSLSVKSVETSGRLTFSSLDGNIDIESSNIYSQKVKLSRGYECMIDSGVTELDVDIGHGYFKYETGGYDMISSVMTLVSDDGRVRYGDDIYENGKFSQGMKYTGMSDVIQIVIDVHVEEGNIMVTK